MRTSLLALLTVLLILPAAAQPDAAGTRAAEVPALEAGDVAFGQITTSSPYFEDGGARFHYEVFTHEAQPGERVTFSARSLDFIPAVFVADGPGLDPELPNQEVSADGQTATMDFYAPQLGVYTFAVLAAESGKQAPWTFQVRLDVAAPLDYGAVYPGGGDPSGRYALLVGVNDYPSNASDLSGTVNDVMKVRALLVEQYGFEPENVLVLTNADATREHVVEAFRRHLGQAGPSGSAVFYYSGHGTQIPDGYLGYDASDETDKNDEALVLWGTGGDFGFLVDEELGGLANTMTAGHRLVVLDNCHSGTGTRDAGEPQLVTARYLDVTDPAVRSRADVPDALIAEADDAGPANHVLLAAARSDQFSIEASGMSDNGESGGIFTYYLVNALKTADPDEPLAAVMDRVRVEVMDATLALKYEDQPEPQEPQAEGTRIGDSVRAFLMQ